MNLETGKPSVFLERPGKSFVQLHWSPDNRWIVFMTGTASGEQVYIAPFTGDQGPSETAWIPITDGSTVEGAQGWSPDGNWIYSLSDRDGFWFNQGEITGNIWMTELPPSP